MNDTKIKSLYEEISEELPTVERMVDGKLSIHFIKKFTDIVQKVLLKRAKRNFLLNKQGKINKNGTNTKYLTLCVKVQKARVYKGCLKNKSEINNPEKLKFVIKPTKQYKYIKDINTDDIN